MFKNLFAALGLSCIIIVLLAACGSVSNDSNPVHMSGSRFLQSSITIKKGESITLVNDDLVGSHVIANGTWVNNTARPVREAGAPSAATTLSQSARSRLLALSNFIALFMQA
jgi:hypothetical protein